MLLLRRSTMNHFHSLDKISGPVDNQTQSSDSSLLAEAIKLMGNGSSAGRISNTADGTIPKAEISSSGIVFHKPPKGETIGSERVVSPAEPSQELQGTQKRKLAAPEGEGGNAPQFHERKNHSGQSVNPDESGTAPADKDKDKDNGKRYNDDENRNTTSQDDLDSGRSSRGKGWFEPKNLKK
jgi:hypothetical protein